VNFLIGKKLSIAVFSSDKGREVMLRFRSIGQRSVPRV
jgi:hypothetical protein